MARRNPARSIGQEANLAKRIARELDARKWSPANLAERLTSAGCSIQTSAVYKVIDGDPPRRISVDELVALSRVLDTTVEDLLTPVEVLDKKRAQEVERALVQSMNDLNNAVNRVSEAWVELYSLAADDSELYEYVVNHLNGPTGMDRSPLFEVLGEVLGPEASPVGATYLRFLKCLTEYGEMAAKKLKGNRNGEH